MRRVYLVAYAHEEVARMEVVSAWKLRLQKKKRETCFWQLRTVTVYRPNPIPNTDRSHFTVSVVDIYM